MLRTIAEQAPDYVLIHLEPDYHADLEGEIPPTGCGWPPCHVCYESEEPTGLRREEKLDYDYGEPFSDEDDVQWVRRTHKHTGHVEVVACEYYEDEVWDGKYYKPHANDPTRLGRGYSLFTPLDLRGAHRWEVVRRKGALVCVAAVLGTVRHPVFWLDEERCEVFAAVSFEKVGERLPTPEDFATWFVRRG